jgi:hypothetical protein
MARSSRHPREVRERVVALVSREGFWCTDSEILTVSVCGSP